MALLFRKRVKIGPIIVNVSQGRITSYTIKFGPWSWNSRTRRQRVNLPGPLSWQSKAPVKCRKSGPHGKHTFSVNKTRYSCLGKGQEL